MIDTQVLHLLQRGAVIPAHPLALDAQRRLDPRRQRALSRYYLASGAGGLAVGVHTTQFAIRNKGVDLLQPVLALAAEEMDRAEGQSAGHRLIRIAGICGTTEQATAEAAIARDLGYHAGLLSLAAAKEWELESIIRHCREVSEVIPLFGFYLQPDVGGCVLPYRFWREFCEIENVVAIKIAPFNRYRSLDVVRAVVDSGRKEIALYTGNDDNIVVDLLTSFRFSRHRLSLQRRMVGGLLGHWAVWTSRAVEMLQELHVIADSDAPIPAEYLRLNAQVTDCNAALFDAANGFRGCIAGIHEVLCRQGLLAGTWCLDPNETLSPGQAEELDRVCTAYPHLVDDQFVRERLDDWLGG